MTYKQLKWLILSIPTLTIGLWEYLRHTLLLPYVSMELGNLLAPFIVFFVTITLLRKLFVVLEHAQDSLRREQSLKAALEQRQQLARELHDGISQSLFLLSVKLDKLDQVQSSIEGKQQTEQIRETVRHVYDNVRQSIAALHSSPVVTDKPWMQSMHKLLDEIREDSGLQLTLDWQLADAWLTPRQKVELLAILREALINVQKHARATTAVIQCYPHTDNGRGFVCTVTDNGIGADAENFKRKGCYGIRSMESRAAAMDWRLEIGLPDRNHNLPGEHGQGTQVTIISEGSG
ncbi:sensor histidine kinase [Paenibacillus sp. GCM10012307]|uniref:histidine kinase n=1 Tax=Paenibacillus roseus TaxID=2798579 RepID=A0A934J354_9BACL|nr:histidine kinase [Paenibacillus roseus]MBJ6363902.1 sensor histidine kinase [Paenibacillus roseus]